MDSEKAFSTTTAILKLVNNVTEEIHFHRCVTSFYFDIVMASDSSRHENISGMNYINVWRAIEPIPLVNTIKQNMPSI